MVNGGQSCIAGKRFIVVRSILERFERALVETMSASLDELLAQQLISEGMYEDVMKNYASFG